MYTDGYKALRAEFDMAFDPHDAWGGVMGWLFGVADVLWHADPDMVPDAWQFHHGAGCDGNTDDYPDCDIQDMLDDGLFNTEDLATFGNTLDRYADMLRANDRSY